MKALNKLYAIGFAGLILTAPAHAALMIDADYDLYFGVSPSYTGDIAGTDNNADGFLQLGEVTSWTLSGYGELVGRLDAIGTFDIGNQTISPDAISWVGFPDTAYFTFDNRVLSCSTYSGCELRFTSFVTSNDVPEPGSLALLGLGLAGLVAMRRKQKAS